MMQRLLAVLLVATLASAKRLSGFQKNVVAASHKAVGAGSQETQMNILRNLFATKAFKPVNDQARRQLNDNVGFDMTQYSIKYSGCSSITTYSDELAEEEEVDTVLAVKRFVTFRLCPSDACNQYSVDGCSENYGEYLLELDDYLLAVSQYYEEKKEQLCEYCRECVEAAQQDDDGNNRRLDEAGDDAAAGDDAVAEEQAMCEDEACADYYTDCEQEDDGNDDGNDYDLAEFMECVAIEYDDDVDYYIAPHCNADGFSVSLGVFLDEQCSTYADNELSASDVAGFDLDTSIFDTYFAKECVACVDANEYADDDGNNNNNQQEEVNEICQELYEASAKCHQKFGDNYYGYQSSNQEAQEQVVCDFITSVKSGTYNEKGEIIIDSWWYFNSTNWREGESYLDELKLLGSNINKKVPMWQIAALVASAVGCVLMWLWIVCLRSALAGKNIPWRPRRDKSTPPGDISRQNSGIVMGRSRSGPGTTPLI